LKLSESIIEERKEAARRYSKEYYKKNTLAITVKRKLASSKREDGQAKVRKQRSGRPITIVDTLSGDRFDYISILACSRDMYIRTETIYKSLNTGASFNDYLFERGVTK